MTASNTVVDDVDPVVQYTATNAQTVFDAPWLFFNDSDLTVYQTLSGATADDTADLLVLTTDYTVTNTDTESGGTIVLNSGAATGDTLTIYRIVTLERQADYQTSGDLLAETLNKEQDVEMMALQQFRVDIARSLRMQRTESAAVSVELPTPIASYLLGWNSAGTALENYQWLDTTLSVLLDGSRPMTGNLTVSGSKSPAIYLLPSDDTGFPQLRLTDSSGTRRGQFFLNAATGELSINRYSAIGVLEAQIQLTSSGNIAITELVPTSNYHLSTKGYTDDQDALQATLASDNTFTGDVLLNQSGQSDPVATRGPLFVFNDPSTVLAGQNTCAQFWTGDNPTATPGADNFVNQTNYINNLNGRANCWAANMIMQQLGLSGYADGTSRIAELEFTRNVGTDAIDDPFGSNVWGAGITYTAGQAATYNGILYKCILASTNNVPPNATYWELAGRSNGLELVGHVANTDLMTSAIMVWAADTTGAGWWNEGVSISRCYNNGVHFYADPAKFDASHTADGTSAFKNAAIYDESDSDVVLKVAGAHTSIFDVSDADLTYTNFCKLDSTADQAINFTNSGDYDASIVLDTGATTTQQSALTLADQGSDMWSFIKNASNDLSIYDHTGAVSAILLDGNVTDAVQILVGGVMKRVQVGASDSGGSGYRMLRVTN